MINNLDFCKKIIDENLDKFTYKFPSAVGIDYIYAPSDNLDWTNAFWTGMLWLMFEMTGDEKYRKVAEIQCLDFKNRIEKRIATDTHDLGFLYTLSTVAEYKITGSEEAKNTSLKAADELIIRYKEKGEFIQAWGSLDDVNNYRLIIDCLLNLPLLYWATEVTGDKKYYNIAYKHLQTTLSVIIRDDFTTLQTFFFDPQTGKPTHAQKHQAYSDDSCWSRGQAWGIYGTALSYGYTKDENLIPIYKGLLDCLISKLPEDYTPYWDLIFTSGDEQRDTSAASIVICGILEMSKYIDEPKYLDIAEKMMNSLTENHTTKDIPNANGLLKDGTSSRPHGSQNNECNIWGDYYYLEAIMRYNNKDWKMYW